MGAFIKRKKNNLLPLRAAILFHFSELENDTIVKRFHLKINPYFYKDMTKKKKLANSSINFQSKMIENVSK